ncbi:MAG: hypothetical protein JW726_03685 [Anaerolineales bacterium]|nr:hypothetical protein [Anaerolineales bacterium]
MKSSLYRLLLFFTLILFLVSGIASAAGPSSVEAFSPTAIQSPATFAPKESAPPSGHSPNGSLAAASHLTAETRLDPWPESDPADQADSAIAYNYLHNEYMVVWENTWPGGKKDIYARRVSDNGQLLSWFCITSGADNRHQPALAYNAAEDEYLVVWQHEVSSGVYEVWGRIVAWNGSYLMPELLIFSWANRSFVAPRVAWNSLDNEYLVAWSAFDTTTLLNTDIACIRVKADGSIPYSHLIIATLGAPQEVDIVYNIARNGYMTVWARHDAATGYDIRGAFLDNTGANITEFDVFVGVSGQTTPAVTTNEQDHYMVVWQHFDDSYTPGDWDIYGRLFQANGSPVTIPFMLSNSTDDEMAPDVAANAASQQYLFVWHRWDNAGNQNIVVSRLRHNDGSMGPPETLLANPGWNAVAPAVACDIPGFLIAYQKGSGWTPYHIYARRLVPNVIYLPLVERNAPWP